MLLCLFHKWLSFNFCSKFPFLSAIEKYQLLHDTWSPALPAQLEWAHTALQYSDTQPPDIRFLCPLCSLCHWVAAGAAAGASQPRPGICWLPVTSEQATLCLEGVIPLLASFTQKGQIRTPLLHVGMRPAAVQFSYTERAGAGRSL